MSSEDLTDTPLHEAVHIGDVEDVRTALKGGYDPNQIGLYLWSPVHEAAHNGDEHILKLLLKHKGNPNQPDLLKGCTSVHYAASQGHKECLQLLVDAGGRYDTLNKDGQTCLDVATENCASILRLQRNEDLIITPRNVIVANILKDTEPLKSDPAKSHPNPCVCEEPDEDISVTSGESQSETHIPRAWDPGTVFGLKKELVLGRVQLSFEYNSKTSSLKIRVWQVTDLLLPPANSSMINSIFVKGYLLPDKKKDSKRKTEEVKVDRDDNGSSTKSKQSGQTIFKISSFKFTKPLEYKNIKPDVIDTRMVQIDVCITQKYTRKNFVIATWNLPLKMAVKKLVREKFALKPCISRNIPANMKVYSANELSVMYTSRHFDSNPNLRYPSLSSLISSQNERSSSDPDLKGVTVQPVPNTPSIVVSLSPEDIHTTAGNWPDKVRVVGQLQPTTEINLHPQMATSQESLPGMMGSDLDLEDIEGQGQQFDEVKVHLPRKASLKKFRSAPDISTDDSESSELESSLNKLKGTFQDVLSQQMKDFSMAEKGRSRKLPYKESIEIQLTEFPRSLPGTNKQQSLSSGKRSSSRLKPERSGSPTSVMESRSKRDSQTTDIYDDSASIPVDVSLGDLDLHISNLHESQLSLATKVDIPEIHSKSYSMSPQPLMMHDGTTAPTSVHYENDLTGMELKELGAGLMQGGTNQAKPVASGYSAFRSPKASPTIQTKQPQKAKRAAPRNK